MTKEEIALQLTTALLDNFKYDFSDFGDMDITEHANRISNLAFLMYSNLLNKLD